MNNKYITQQLGQPSTSVYQSLRKQKYNQKENNVVPIGKQLLSTQNSLDINQENFKQITEDYNLVFQKIDSFEQLLQSVSTPNPKILLQIDNDIKEMTKVLKQHQINAFKQHYLNNIENNEEIQQLIQQFLQKERAKYSDQINQLTQQNEEMKAIIESNNQKKTIHDDEEKQNLIHQNQTLKTMMNKIIDESQQVKADIELYHQENKKLQDQYRQTTKQLKEAHDDHLTLKEDNLNLMLVITKQREFAHLQEKEISLQREKLSHITIEKKKLEQEVEFLNQTQECLRMQIEHVVNERQKTDMCVFIQSKQIQIQEAYLEKVDENTQLALEKDMEVIENMTSSQVWRKGKEYEVEKKINRETQTETEQRSRSYTQ